jgi:MFS family permease
MSLRQALRTREFYILWLIYCINNQVVQYLNIIYKTYGQTFIEDDQFLALVGSIAAIFNSGGRIIWGFIIDRISVKICMVVLCVMVTILYLTMTQTEHGGKAMYAIWVWASFFFFSGNYAIFPATCAKTFGPEFAGPIYGLVGTAMLAAGIIFSFATEDMASSIGWFGSFAIQAGMSIVSLFLILFYRDTERQLHKPLSTNSC